MASSAYLLQEVCSQHENLGIRAEALHGGEIAHPLLVRLLGRHDLENMERCPGHVMTDHFEVHELQEGRGLDVCPTAASAIHIFHGR